MPVSTSSRHEHGARTGPRTERKPKPNGRAKHEPAPFDLIADQLWARGYSPVALVRKRPIDEDWTRWCQTVPAPTDIAARKGRAYNVGIACGYNGLVGLDIDTDNAEIEAAIRSVIPASTVAKRGQRGGTDFYRAEGAVPPSRQIRDRDDKVIVEVLSAGRQSVLPPSVHPDTRKAYTWLTPATLLEMPVSDLPKCPLDIEARLREVLKPWLAPEPRRKPKSAKPPPVLTKDMSRRQRVWALAGIQRETGKLRLKTKPGRNRALFDLVCKFGKFVHHGIITDAELREPALSACENNGVMKENGRHDCERTIDRGLREALGDALEDLPDRSRSSAKSSAREQHQPKHEQAAPEAGEPCPANEDAIASAFAERHKPDLRYCHSWGAWFRWTGTHWARDKRRLAFHYARQAARDANREGKAGPAKASTAAGVERFAQADPRLATTSDDWDQNAWLLATPDGTVDLRTGSLREASPTDFITKSASVGPVESGSRTPIWDAFLRDATDHNDELIGYLQRVAGYCLTGDVSEQALFFVYGDGGNGKGVFINTLGRILGDYGTVASMETFTTTPGSRHPTDLAMLCGSRLVTAQETEEGRAWAEVRIKSLTGGDPISARFMRQDFFTFEPTFKLVVAGNHKPNLKSVDPAVRRRFNIIPFTHKPAKVDPHLAEKLRPEWPGILRWCIEGCVAWQRDGLMPPSIVCDATSNYFAEQDTIGQWLEECCDVGEMKADTSANLFGSWKSWAERNGDSAGNAKGFRARMEKLGFEAVKNTPGSHGKRGYRGVRVRAADTSQQWQNKMYA